MSYTIRDFAETLMRAVPPSRPLRVMKAWGATSVERDGWEGGFLLGLEDGRLAYLSGWMESGDNAPASGADIRLGFSEEQLYLEAEVSEYDPNPIQWDEEPADLNKWLRDGMPDPFSV